MPTKKKITQTTIALCVIAKDEEAMLADCLDSAREFVDEVIVLDTGSTDRTIEVARAHGARIGEFIWCDDFAAAKNAALDLATTDWVLFIDADERLTEGGPRLHELARELPAGLHGYELELENLLDNNNIVTHRATRFFPRRPDLRFRGALHEALEYAPAPETTRSLSTSAIRLSHLGYQPALYVSKGKDKRNLQILQRELEKNPDDARALFYLALQHLTQERTGQAYLYLRRFIDRADQLPRRFTIEAYRMQIQALLGLGDFVELERLEARLGAANQLNAFARELLATYAAETGQLDKAVMHLKAGLDPSAPTGLQAPAGCGTWRTRAQLANAYERLDDFGACLEAMQLATDEAPQAVHAKYALITAQVAARLGKLDVASRWLLVAAEWADDDVQIHIDILRERLGLAQLSTNLPALEQAIVHEDWQAAYQEAMVLPLDRPAALAQLLLVGDRLREGGAPDAALDLLNRALDGSAPTVPLYWRLTQTLTDLGRFDDAVMASDALRHIPGAGKAVFGN
jgi:glycosyltransferase involved in cell wall biosynthesis